jgi:hypothetical protein
MLAATTDIKGQKFGRLTVLQRADNDKRRNVMWLCQCDCSSRTKLIVRGHSLRSGNTKSCGCLQPGLTMRSGKTTPEYYSYHAMLTRCGNLNHMHFKNYGGRGIKVCKRWVGKNGFVNFLADMGPRPKGKTLDRFPNRNGNYEPGNTRWAIPKQQRIGQRNTKLNFKKAQRIRALASGGVSQVLISQKFKVSMETIRLVILRKIWRAFLCHGRNPRGTSSRASRDR